jgi:hypothetical protein
MATIRRLYGASPAHLAALLAGLALTAYAARELLEERPADVGVWFAGAAVLHDAALLPLYVAADAALVALWRRRPGRVPWLNFVRVPAAVSGVLLLAYSTTILRLSDGAFEHKTGRADSAYTAHWLTVTAALGAVSAVWYALRVLATRPRRP